MANNIIKAPQQWCENQSETTKKAWKLATAVACVVLATQVQAWELQDDVSQNEADTVAGEVQQNPPIQDQIALINTQIQQIENSNDLSSKDKAKKKYFLRKKITELQTEQIRVEDEIQTRQKFAIAQKRLETSELIKDIRISLR